jgi:hypothetical protein
MLTAMAREWQWKHTAAAVSVSDYLDNADNLGASFVNVAHWIATTDAGRDDVPAILAATRAAQRVVRILNDIATYPRDRRWGDLNLLMLPGGEAAARDRLPSLIDEHLRLARALPRAQKRFATFLARQVEFCRGFYGLTDFWGTT